MACILQRAMGVIAMEDKQALIEHRLNAWAAEKHHTLVADIKEECMSAIGGGGAKNDEATARNYNKRVLSGRL